jgi:t-SNARE complex subunit (syntaxin)
MARDGPTAKTYPQPEQYERWKNRAAEVDMSISEFIQSMVEAGMKVDQGLEMEIRPDETVHELREQRNDMKAEVDHLRERVDKLEERLHDSERAAVENHVEDLGMASHDQVLDHVRETAPVRVTRHLEALSGDSLRQNPNGLWEPLDGERTEA